MRARIIARLSSSPKARNIFSRAPILQGVGGRQNLGGARGGMGPVADRIVKPRVDAALQHGQAQRRQILLKSVFARRRHCVDHRGHVLRQPALPQCLMQSPQALKTRNRTPPSSPQARPPARAGSRPRCRPQSRCHAPHQPMPRGRHRSVCLAGGSVRPLRCFPIVAVDTSALHNIRYPAITGVTSDSGGTVHRKPPDKPINKEEDHDFQTQLYRRPSGDHCAARDCLCRWRCAEFRQLRADGRCGQHQPDHG